MNSPQQGGESIATAGPNVNGEDRADTIASVRYLRGFYSGGEYVTQQPGIEVTLKTVDFAPFHRNRGFAGMAINLKTERP
jgi:hypothetical protein